MQGVIFAGDTLIFTADYPTYPASDGWTLTYRLIPSTGTPISFSATASGTSYAVSVPAATTAAWAAGGYGWTGYVTKAGERHTVEQGWAEIKPDPSLATGIDTRSHARKVLDAIQAVIEKRASKDQMGYTINGRELRRTPLADLEALQTHYELKVRAEDRLAQGLSPMRFTYPRFIRG